MIWISAGAASSSAGCSHQPAGRLSPIGGGSSVGWRGRSGKPVRKAYPHQRDGRARRPEFSGEAGAGGQHLIAVVGSFGEAHDAALQVDKDEGSGARIEAVHGDSPNHEGNLING